MLVYANDINALVYWDGDSLDWYLVNENINGGGSGFDNDWIYDVDTMYNDNAQVVIGDNNNNGVNYVRLLVKSNGLRTGMAGSSSGDGNTAVGSEGFATGNNNINIGALGICRINYE